MIPFVHHAALEINEVGLGAAPMIGVEHITAVGLFFLVMEYTQGAADGFVGLGRNGNGAKSCASQKGDEFTHGDLLHVEWVSDWLIQFAHFKTKGGTQ